MKGFVAKNRLQLLEGYKRFYSNCDGIILQEFVRGDDDSEYSLATYFNESCEPLTVFTARKLRQLPPEAGVGTLVESCVEPAVVKLGISFLRKLNFKGIAEVEFKRGQKDGHFRLIEVNTRIWAQNNLAVRCGADIPYIAYCDASGMELNRNTFVTDTPIKWFNFSGDFLACFSSTGYVWRKKLTIKNWLTSLRGKKEYAIFACDDISPFIKSLGTFALRLLHSIIKRLQFP
jgi:predicted ATP-grasp superfamily ATP-dependent carboligase